MRKLLLAVFVLFLLTNFVSAERVCGFRGACLSNHSAGLYFNASEYDFNLTVWVNDLNVPDGNLENRIFYRFNNTDGFKWVHAVKLRRTWLTSGLVDNMSMVVVPERGVTMEHTGTGELTFRRGALDFDVVSFGDLIRTLNYFNLNAREDFNGTHYRILLRGFDANTPLFHETGGWGWVVLDPTVSAYSLSNFTLGAFNTTYVNASQSVQTYWYPNNLSFAGNGTYYSPALKLNATNASWINNVNWSWYEAIGMALEDEVIGSWSFENDSKDTSRFNNTMFRNSSASSLPTFNQSCIVGGCYHFDGNDFLSGYNINTVGTSNITQAISISAWVRPYFNNSDNNYILSKATFGSFCGYGMALASFNSTHRRLTMALGNGTHIPTVDTSVYVPLNQWTHVGITYNVTNSSVFFYRNGQLAGIGQGPLNTIQNCVQALTIGARFQETMHGNIDEVHLWNRSISQSEMSQLYSWETAPTGRGNEGFIHNFTSVSLAFRAKNYTFNDTTLSLWWDLGDSGENQTFSSIDLSGNGSNGILNRTASVQYPQEVSGNCVVESCLQTFRSGSFGSWVSARNSQLNIGNGNVTIMIWARGVESDTFTREFFAMSSTSTNFQKFTLATHSGYVTLAYRNNSAAAAEMNSTFLIGTGWNLYTAVKNGSSLSLYANGVLLNTTFIENIGTFTTNVVSVGGMDRLSPSIGASGFYDTARVWFRALSPEEISSFYPTSSETNWTSFTTEYTGSNASVANVAGRLLQYRATFTSLSTNYSAFLKNVSINYDFAAAPVNNPPQSFFTQTNVTTVCSGQPVVFGNYWTDDSGLTDSTFYLDNGNGTFYSQGTTIFEDVTESWDNRTIVTNTTPNSVIRGYWNASDSLAQTNGTITVSLTTTDCEAPKWFNPRTNSTQGNTTALFLADWTDNYRLFNWTFEFDSGNGTLYNISTGFFNGTSNVSNGTAFLNNTNFTLIRYRFYAWDAYGNMNATNLSTFHTNSTNASTPSAGVSYLTCNDGSYIKNQPGQVYFYANATGVSCQIRVLNENLTQVVGYTVMTESATEPRWFNYTANFTKAGKYWASFNCSNGYSASNDIAAVNSCMPTILLSTDANSNKMDATLFFVFLLLAGVLYVWGYTTKNAFLRMAAFAWLIAVAFLVFSGSAFQLPITNSTIDTSSSVITASTTTTLADVKNSWTDNLGLLILSIGVLMGMLEGINYWQNKNGE